MWLNDSEQPIPNSKRRTDMDFSMCRGRARETTVNQQRSNSSTQIEHCANRLALNTDAGVRTTRIACKQVKPEKGKFESVPEMATWRFRPKRESKKEVTPQEKADFQLSIDRQMKQAGLAHPTSPVWDILSESKKNIIALCAQAVRFIKHIWAVSKVSKKPLTEETKMRRTCKLSAAIHRQKHS